MATLCQENEDLKGTTDIDEIDEENLQKYLVIMTPPETFKKLKIRITIPISTAVVAKIRLESRPKLHSLGSYVASEHARSTESC